MPISFNPRTRRFTDSKGRFVSKKRGLGSQYARTEYYEYYYKNYPTPKLKVPYQKILEQVHIKIGTKDFIFLLGSELETGILKLKQYYAWRTETSQFRVVGFRKGKEFAATSWSRFNDEFFEDWNTILKELIEKLSGSGVTIKSIYVIMKKFINA